jgi:hypothetical protein
MERSLISIGFEIPGHSTKTRYYFCGESLLDHDIVVFSPAIPSVFTSAETYQGKPSLSEEPSFRVKEQMERWRRELSNAFEHGKTVFILMDERAEFFIDSGKSETSGTGRNQRRTTFVYIC